MLRPLRPAIRNLRPTLGMASNTTTRAPACAAASAAISQAGLAPTIATSMVSAPASCIAPQTTQAPIAQAVAARRGGLYLRAMNDAPTLFAFTVEPDEAGARLDKYLAERPALAEAHVSRTRIKALAEEGRVRVDGCPAASVSTKVAAGKRKSRSKFHRPRLPEPLPENIPLNIVHEDEHLIVIDKPAGLVVHPAAGHAAGTLVNALIAHCGDSLSGVGGVRRPGIVHRLDKDTSGLLVVAKTDAAHQGSAALFADHGRTTPFERISGARLGRADRKRAGRSMRRSAGIRRSGNGWRAARRSRKEAITHRRLIERNLGRTRNGKPVAPGRLPARDGRTHQIRVHMAHIGCPVVGDPVYATGFRTKEKLLPEKARAAVAALGRQALHAAVLAFPHP